MHLERALDARSTLSLTPELAAATGDPCRWPGGGWNPPIRVIAETVATLTLLILSVPVMLAAAVVVRVTSRGPAMYAQEWLGCRGRLFSIYKSRSMYDTCEKLSGPC